MEILTKFQPYGNSIMIERVMSVSNIALNSIGKVKPEHEKELSITIVAVGEEKYNHLIGKEPMFPVDLKQLMINGSATIVTDLSNIKSLKYYHNTRKELIDASTPTINISGSTKFTDYYMVNINYLIGIK